MEVNITVVHNGKFPPFREFHFSGGIKGRETENGLTLFPTSNEPSAGLLLFPNKSEFFSFAINDCNLAIVGSCEEYLDDYNDRLMSLWRTGMPYKGDRFNAADLWKAIAVQASLVGDDNYQKYSSNLSASLRGAGLRLRDISNHYNYQLKKALQENIKPGTYYSNATLMDIYNDCHSLLSELSSARDYLSKIAAIHANAPSKVDSLSSLKDWLNKAGNSHQFGDPMIKALLKASGTESKKNWLWYLGDKRNEMLHRQPMGANKLFSAFHIVGNKTQYGEIITIQIGEPPRTPPNEKIQNDPIVFISELATNLEILCKRFVLFAKYSSKPPIFDISK